MMHKTAEYPVEEPVESPAAQGMLHDIVQVKHRSELRALGGAHLGRLLVSGQITPAEHQILHDELTIRRKSLTMPANAEPPFEPEVDTHVPARLWSPTDILNKIPPRELDARERAAGEHFDRNER